MATPASLVELCGRAMAELANRDAAKRQELFRLPSDLLADIVPLLSPLALESLQTQANYKLSFVESCGDSHAKQHINLKRSFDAMIHGCSLCCLNGAWKKQFDKGWPSGLKKLRFDTLLAPSEVRLLNLHHDEALMDWRQHFWEAYVQECLNDAVAQISTLHHQIPLSNLTLSNRLSQLIGYELANSGTRAVTCCLKYICSQFGKHARYLRLRGALCTKELSILLSSCTGLQHIVCSHIDTAIQVEGLCLLLSQISKRLQILEFQNCRFADYGLLKISGALKANTENHCLLQHLFVHSSRNLFMRSSQSSQFMLFLRACRCLRSLVLIDNQVDLATASGLFSSIPTGMLHLSLFHVRENELMGLTAPSFEPLSPRNISSSLKAFDIRSNNITSQDIKEFSSYFQYVPFLEHLNLSDNPIGDEGLIALFPVLDVLKLSELSLSACDLSMKGVCSLLELIISSKRSLQSLSLSHNLLSSSMAVPLANFLCQGVVERVDIGDIGLGIDGCLGLVSALKEIPRLSHLILRKNRLGSSGAALFSKLMTIPNSLKVIDLSSNLLDKQCLQSVAFQLGSLQGGMLELVDLRNNMAEDLKVFENIKKPQVLLSEVCTLFDDDP